MSERLVEATTYRDHAMTARLVTARKFHPCDYARDVSWGRACHTIRPGEQYVRVTVFPGHDFRDVPQPESGACCIPCAEGYSGLDELAALAAPTTTEPQGQQGANG